METNRYFCCSRDIYQKGIMTEKEFTAEWIRKLSDGSLKAFPDSFLTTDNTKMVSLPGIDLLLGEELFGNYDLLDTKRNSVLMVDDYYTAKYIIYSNRSKPSKVLIPLVNDEIIKMVKAYEAYLDKILKLIETEYNSLFPKSRNHLTIINDVFNHLNIKRI